MAEIPLGTLVPSQTLPTGAFILVGTPLASGQQLLTFAALDPTVFTTPAQVLAIVEQLLAVATTTSPGTVAPLSLGGLAVNQQGFLSLNGNNLPTTPGVPGSGTPWLNGTVLAFS